ncbi:MAG TPA: MFS transporter [Burkholderiales bacterium]
MSSRVWQILGWLALGSFAIGTTGYMIAGLLPAITSDLGVSTAAAGQLFTVYALAFAAGSPLLAVATSGIERKRLLMAAMAALALCSAFAALTESFALLLVAQVALALAAGTFMPAASAYAAAAAPVERRGRALSIVIGGLTLAMVIGVPVGAVVGEHFGWRLAYAGVALLALLVLVGTAASLPPLKASAAVTLSERLAVARRPDILGALALTMITLAGAFSIYTYLAPFLRTIGGLSGSHVAAVLFLFGLGGAAGNLAGGAISDRGRPSRLLVVVLVALIGLFALLSLAGTFLPEAAVPWVIVPAIAIWGLVGWSFPSIQQVRLVAMEPRLMPITLSLNASASYAGISLGAALGSIVVAKGAIGAIGWAGAGCETLALVVLLYSLRMCASPRSAHVQGRPSQR